jgi:hypothetical protein
MVNRVGKWVLGCGLLVVMGACTGQTQPTSDATADTGDATADTGDTTAASSACPVQPPAPDAVCTVEGQACDYGDNPRCLTQATCASGKWKVPQVKCAAPDPTCPATRESAAGQACTTQDGYCNYAGLICECTNCSKYPVVQCSGAKTWHCDAPNTTPGCPAARPLVGQACGKEGMFCDYGCEAHVSRTCTGGAWTASTSPNGCAISTRAAKNAIRYLAPADRVQVADAARALQLATWHYKDPAVADRQHLGYILEDAPLSPSSDMEKRQVDLYSYTSMVLALAQQQDEEIHDLRAKMAVLEARLNESTRRR